MRSAVVHTVSPVRMRSSSANHDMSWSVVECPINSRAVIVSFSVTYVDCGVEWQVSFDRFFLSVLYRDDAFLDKAVKGAVLSTNGRTAQTRRMTKGKSRACEKVAWLWSVQNGSGCLADVTSHVRLPHQLP